MGGYEYYNKFREYANVIQKFISNFNQVFKHNVYPLFNLSLVPHAELNHAFRSMGKSFGCLSGRVEGHADEYTEN